jgi:signal peptidase I
VEEALSSGDPSRLEVAQRSLEEAFARHLAAFRKSPLRSWVEVVFGAAALALLVRTFLLEAVHLDSAAMVPSLLPGDVVLVSKAAYGLRIPGTSIRLGRGEIARGDVILFDRPDGEGRAIQRVIGLPGETVEIVDRTVHVNGVPLARRLLEERLDYWSHRADLDFWYPRSGSVWIEEGAKRPHTTLASRSPLAPPHAPGPREVPDGHVFVLGDNRDFSEGGSEVDGRLLPMDAVRGRVVRVAFSWGPGKGGDRGLRTERFFARPDGSRLMESARGSDEHRDGRGN